MAHGISVPSGRRAVPRGSKRLLALRGDEHLVERLRRGDEAAFEVIYERHVPGVLSFCRHMLGSREEGEDAVQHAFTAAHRDLLRDEREIRLKPWLYAIARNRCVSMLRARQEQDDERVEASTDGLDGEVQRRADLRELVQDLHDLPESQRAALVLSELRDLSHADVAEVLGCGVANVKGLVFRARSGLGERREARDTSCECIQQELATAQGGTLRRGKLRHHLRACAPCSAYLEDVRRQRKMMAAILPVVPTAGLKSSVLAAVGIGGGGAGAGGAAAGGGLLTAILPAGGATAAKVAIIGAVVVGGGGAVGGAAALHGSFLHDAAPADSRPGHIDSAGAAERKGSGATGLVSDRSRPDQKTHRKSSDADHGKTSDPVHGKPSDPNHGKSNDPTHGKASDPNRGNSSHPPSSGRGRGSGGGQPGNGRGQGGAPKVPHVPQGTPQRPRPVAPVKPKPQAAPPGQTGRPVDKPPVSNGPPVTPGGGPPLCPGKSKCP